MQRVVARLARLWLSSGSICRSAVVKVAYMTASAPRPKPGRQRRRGRTQFYLIVACVVVSTGNVPDELLAVPIAAINETSAILSPFPPKRLRFDVAIWNV